MQNIAIHKQRKSAKTYWKKKILVLLGATVGATVKKWKTINFTLKKKKFGKDCYLTMRKYVLIYQ